MKSNSTSARDSIFLDTTPFGMYTTCSVLNCLLDHDAQMLELYVVNLNSNINIYKNITIKTIGFNTVNELKVKLCS
jgi:hypothetical protein